MIKVEVGGFPFMIKQRWSEVNFSEALRLFNTKTPFDVVRILSIPNMPDIKVIPDMALALYELCSFVEESPDAEGKPMEISEWSYRQFELIRKAVGKHPNALPLTFGRIAYILNSESLNDGVRAMIALQKFVEEWKDTSLFDSSEPTPEERAAGIERLQAFGTYGILESVAAKYGKLPREIEEESCVWVLTEWLYQNEKRTFENNLK